MKQLLFTVAALGITLLLCASGELSSTAMASPRATTSSAKKPTRVAQASKATTPARSRKAAQSSTRRDDGLTGRKLKTLIFGDGDDIEGAVQGPAGDDVTGRTSITHTNLIPIREHFLPELYRSADDI